MHSGVSAPSQKPNPKGFDEPAPARVFLLRLARVAFALVGLQLSSIPLMAALVLFGGATVYVAARRVLPAYTLTFGRGLPAILAMRGILTFGYFGPLAFFPMALQLVRGLSPTLAGVGVSAGSMGWTSGSWAAVALDRRFGITARPQVVRVGLTLMALGTTGTIGTLVHGFPVAIAIVCWGLAGLGTEIAYNTNSVLAIQAETEHNAATVSSSMQLTDSLGQVLGTGMGGAVVATCVMGKMGYIGRHRHRHRLRLDHCRVLGRDWVWPRAWGSGHRAYGAPVILPAAEL